MSVSKAKSSAKSKKNAKESRLVKRFKFGNCQVWINSQERTGRDGPYEYRSSRLSYSYWNSNEKKYVNLSVFLPLDELLNMSEVCRAAYGDQHLMTEDEEQIAERFATNTATENDAGVVDETIDETA